MANIYGSIEGFTTRRVQLKYYALSDNLQSLANNAETEVITAIKHDGELLGCVVYFGDLKFYGSVGAATRIVYAFGLQ